MKSSCGTKNGWWNHLGTWIENTWWAKLLIFAAIIAAGWLVVVHEVNKPVVEFSVSTGEADIIGTDGVARPLPTNYQGSYDADIVP